MEVINRSLVDNALWNLGLPVKCKSCGETGVVKPDGKYNGWWRKRLVSGGSWWYCPADAERVRTYWENRREPQFTQPVETNPEDDLNELLSIID